MKDRKREPYRSFMAWMLVNNVSRKEIQSLLNIKASTLSRRLQGTGPDFTIKEVRTLVSKYGEEVSQFFLA